MSYAFVQDIAATWEQYEHLAAAIAARPEGLVIHVAGPTDKGFRIIGVWESEAAWERFEAERQGMCPPPRRRGPRFARSNRSTSSTAVSPPHRPRHRFDVAREIRLFKDVRLGAPRGPTSRQVSTGPLPFTSTSPSGSATKSSRRSSHVARVIWIASADPCDSILLAMFTVSPHRS